MPRLWGTGGKPLQNEQLGLSLPDQFLSLTDRQLNHLKEWAEGDFEVGTPPKPVALETLPLAEQPHALDSSALEPTIGGGFHPGIEFPYLILYRESFAEAFRVDKSIEPGSLSAYMSSPWQGDFWSCNVAWWPTQRPDIVFEYDRKSQTRTYKEWFADTMNTVRRSRLPMVTIRWLMPGQDWVWCCRSRMRMAAS